MSFVDRILEELGSAPSADARLSLYALLDAAREGSVVAMLEKVPETSESLYEGESHLAELWPRLSAHGRPLL